MTPIVKQLIALVVFSGLLVGVLILRHQSDKYTLPKDEALKRYGFYLEEVSNTAGIEFTHQAPTLDAKLEHIMPIVASMGAAVSIVDFNRDGLPDIYVINSGEGSKNRLYQNLGDGTFKDVAEEMGVADLNQPGT